MTDMLFILDRNKNVIGYFSNNGADPIAPFFDDKYVSELSNGAETYEFSTLNNAITSELLELGNYVLFKHGNKYKMFQIMDIEDNHSNGQQIITCYCEMAGLELLTDYCDPFEIEGNIELFFNTVLQDTNWRLGGYSASLKTNIQKVKVDKYTNVYKVIQDNISIYGNIEIEFRVEFENNRLLGFFIDVYANGERGSKVYKRFEYGENVSGITRKINLNDFTSAMIGIGKDNLTFKDIEWKKGKGDPADKPLGQDFIVDLEANDKYNKYGKYIKGLFDDSNITNPQDLLLKTWEKLQEVKEPRFDYEVDLALTSAEYEDIKIGDTNYVIDHDYNPPILLEARIGKLELSLSDSRQNKCTLSNYKEVVSKINDSIDITGTVNDAIDKYFPITSEGIADGAITDGKIETKYYEQITADIVSASKVVTEQLIVDKANIKDLQATNATVENLKAENVDIKNIVAEKASIKDLEVERAKIENLKVNVADIDNLLAGNITAKNIQAGTITAGSGIIANGAIGNAQISSIDAGKISAGKIDTSKVEVAGVNNHLKIKGNRLQVFQGVGNQAVERVSVGDVNGNGSVYGLRVRGADGQTVLLDENGVKGEGITNGAITNEKISEDANIDGSKINVNSVIDKINEDGSKSIKGTKVVVGDGNLEVKLSDITEKQTEHTESIKQAQSDITANKEQIKLKVSEQTYTEDKKENSKKFETISSDITSMKESIKLKVEKTDITNAINEIEIGIRNVLLGTGTPFVMDGTNTANQCKVAYYFSRRNNHGLKQSTVSIRFKYKVSEGATGKFLLQTNGYTGESETGGFWTSVSSQIDVASKPEGTYTRVFTFNCPEEKGFNGIQVRMDNFVGTLTVEEMMIVEGNKELKSWMPAPEDVDERFTSIDQKISEITITDEKIVNTVKSHKTNGKNTFAQQSDITQLDNSWTAKFNDGYNQGIVSMNKNGITVTANNVKSKTSMSANGFKITKTDTNEEVFKVNSNGRLVLDGEFTTHNGNRKSGYFGLDQIKFYNWWSDSNEAIAFFYGGKTSDNKRSADVVGKDMVSLGVGQPNSGTKVLEGSSSSLKIYKNTDFNGYKITNLNAINEDSVSKDLWINKIYLRTNQVNSCMDSGYLNLNYWRGGTATSSAVKICDGTNSGTQGKLQCGDFKAFGTKNACVQTDIGYVDINAYETADYYFGDIGETLLDNDGYSYVYIDSLFAQTVNTTRKYQVFLSVYGEGDANVIERTPNYFVIKGTPGIEIGYEIKAKRKGYEDYRLERDVNSFIKGEEHGLDLDYKVEKSKFEHDLTKSIQENLNLENKELILVIDKNLERAIGNKELINLVEEGIKEYENIN